MVTTVANPEENLVAQHRMDGVWPASVSVSQDEAYTSATLQIPTHELVDRTNPGESLWGMQTTDGNRLVVFGDDYSLETDGELVATAGVSGDGVSQDMTVVEATLDAFDEFAE